MSDQIACRFEGCAGQMQPTDAVEHPKGEARIDLLACSVCGRRAAMMWEIADAWSAEAASWVEQEVAKRGAFFPSDYGGSGRDRW